MADLLPLVSLVLPMLFVGAAFFMGIFHTPEKWVQFLAVLPPGGYLRTFFRGTPNPRGLPRGASLVLSPGGYSKNPFRISVRIKHNPQKLQTFWIRIMR
jgi:hypothetical protein